MSAVFQGSSAATTAGGATTISAPSGVQDGDLLVMLISGTAVLTCDTPAGWTPVNPPYVTSNRVFAFVRVAASEPSSYVVGTNNSQCVTAIGCWRGVDPDAAVDVVSVDMNHGNSATPVAEGITTDADGCEILYLIGTNGAPAFTPPAGYAARVAEHITTAFSVYMADTTQATAGATGDQTATLGSSQNYNTFLLALTPAAAGSPPPSNTTAPAVTGATPWGSTLTADDGTWDGAPTSFTYQWQRAGADIPGATDPTYVTRVTDLGKAIRCIVTATSENGSTPAASNAITVTAPAASAMLPLKWAPPAQDNPTVIDLTASPGDFFVSSGAGNLWTPDADYIIELSKTVPRTGLLEIDANGARSVHIIGGLWALTDGGSKNYHIHIRNLKGWAFIEGQEADMAATHADFCSVSGGNLYTPDVYFQNCRLLNLTADNSTNHADIFQPQGKIANVYADRITFSSNYDGYTIASDGSIGNQPAEGFQITRHNAWYSSPNPVNHFTAFFWIVGLNGSTEPSPIRMSDVFIDLERGAGRDDYPDFTEAAFYPNTGVIASGSSFFADGELIGASDNADGTFSSFTNPNMLVTGGVTKGSPAADRSDVFVDDQGNADFVPAGVGYQYESPGYVQASAIDAAGGTLVVAGGSLLVAA